MCLTVTLASLIFCCTTQHSVLKFNVLKICLDLACFSLLSLLPSALRFKRKNTVWMSQNPCCNFRTAEERRIISMQFSLYSKKHMVYKPFFECFELHEGDKKMTEFLFLVELLLWKRQRMLTLINEISSLPCLIHRSFHLNHENSDLYF